MSPVVAVRSRQRRSVAAGIAPRVSRLISSRLSLRLSPRLSAPVPRVLPLIAMLLAGCTMAPVYHRPDSSVDTTYPAQPKPSGAAPSTATTVDKNTTGADLARSSFFKDPALRQLIDLTLQNNRTLQVAALQVEQYAAQYRIARAALAPAVSADASQTRSHALGATTASSSVNLGISAWELDFFGRLRSLKQQALEQYLATDAARRSTELTLVAATATDYLTWLADRSLLEITEQTVASDQNTYDTTAQAEALGVGSMQDVAAAKTTLESARSSLAAYRRAVAQDRNNLVAAIGCPLPANFPEDRVLSDDLLLSDVPAGLPSSLLTRRPDIVEAEHTLKAANAYVGAARAAFFPAITLTASAGTSSTALSDLFKAGTGAWAFAPDITLPIFNYGELRASLDVAKITKNIDIANYQGTIQTAFKEVANGLAGQTTYRDQVQADQAYVASSQDYYAIAQGRYNAGLDGFLTFLIAQRTLYTAQTQSVNDRLNQQVNLITLYTALGGGWNDSASIATSTSTPASTSTSASAPASASSLN